MSEEPRHKHSGATIEEYLAALPDELEYDEVALWFVTSRGYQSFGLKGDGLSDFVHRAVIALVKRDAKPAIPVRLAPIAEPIGVRPLMPPRPTHGWQALYYGDTPKAIADGIVADPRIKEWLSTGGEPIHDPIGIWFVLPKWIDWTTEQLALPPSERSRG